MSYPRSPEIKRVVKALRDAVDDPLASVEVSSDGTIRVLTKAQATEQRAAPLDQWRAKRGPRAA